MTSIQVINYIANHPEFTNVVLSDVGEITPIQAIAYLSGSTFLRRWAIHIQSEILFIY